MPVACARLIRFVLAAKGRCGTYMTIEAIAGIVFLTLIFVVAIALFFDRQYTIKNLAEEPFHRKRFNIRSREEYIKTMRESGAPDETLDAIRARWREQDAAKIPPKPQHILPLQGAIITYECYDLARAPEIDRMIHQLIQAHPEVNLKEYEKNFGFTIVRIDQPKPKKKVGFIGRN
jgi:hypothetical protein